MRRSLRIAFVTTWYGEHIGGGAESQARTMVKAFRELYPDIAIEVITTCLKEFSSDWNMNVHSPGLHRESDVDVRRFLVEPCPREGFGDINTFRLMPSINADLISDRGVRSPLSPVEEERYLECMVTSSAMVEYLENNKSYYDYFLLLPYMFGIVVQAVEVLGKKAILIPCLHDERYAYMNIYRNMMRACGGILFNVDAEYRLAQRLVDLSDIPIMVPGEIVDHNIPLGDEQRFRSKYKIEGPYLLYAGRQIAGKNLPQLVDYYCRGREIGSFLEDVKLVLIGGGDLDYASYVDNGVLQLGHVSVGDKFDAMSGSLCLCQPSVNESFSLVIMESWLQERPVIVSAKCEVTKDHCEISGGGFTYSDFSDFVDCINRFLSEPAMASDMATKGREYVIQSFSKQIVMGQIVRFFNQLKEANIGDYAEGFWQTAKGRMGRFLSEVRR